MMAVSRGRMSEHKSENIFRNSMFAHANPNTHSTEARRAGHSVTLAADHKLTDRPMGCLALARSSHDALGLDECREGYLFRLFFSMSSVSRKVVFSIRQTGNVFAK